ncbi:hypothetical protein [Draconibacterium sediminis]|uniref:Uncharacterized protein n=1 Tax=Draconibacterium sediminis TaxID=1544798 RepID=A0A0D8JCM7_9BACT|nr:hypothetical protein [Draconibacterium sediminis]KJF44271.1 hypothetical protein LH29_01780 [Draconibacterium sediminis]
MPKLYIFGIGGTGSRVLKAFTMLLASGVKLGNDINSVVPVIIDPDASNGDLNRTVDIIKLYQSIRNEITDPGEFFGTRLETVYQTQNNSPFAADQLQFNINGVETKKFKQFIGDGAFSPQNDAIKELLFSDNNLEADMSVGFKGHPNIGSVVLKSLVDNPQFAQFAQSFQRNDKIFIVNSIFGGTGAAGFPLLLKVLRSGDPKITNCQDIQNAHIGAITVLPYFNVTNDTESQISSDTFMEKAKSAMGYYQRSIIANNELNELYYIGDDLQATFKNNEGAKAQKNDAHFVELASALAIFDFVKQPGNNTQTQFKEFGIQDGSKQDFTMLDATTRQLITKPMSKFAMSKLYLKVGLSKVRSANTLWYVGDLTKTNEAFFNSPSYTHEIERFQDYFEEWLNEMALNKMPFSPFNLKVNNKNALFFIENVKPRKKGVIRSDDSFDGLTKENNECFKNFNSHTPTHQLIKMLEASTEKILNQRNLI